MRRILVWTVAALGLVLLVSGCTSESHQATPSPSVSSVSAVPQTGLRGVRLPKWACPIDTYRDGHRRVISRVSSFGLCELGQPGVLVTISPTKPTRFAALKRVLSQPDVTPSLDCLAPAYGGPWVIARTPSGVWLLHLPADACGGPQAAVTTLLRGLTAGRV